MRSRSLVVADPKRDLVVVQLVRLDSACTCGCRDFGDLPRTATLLAKPLGRPPSLIGPRSAPTVGKKREITPLALATFIARLAFRPGTRPTMSRWLMATRRLRSRAVWIHGRQRRQQKRERAVGSGRRERGKGGSRRGHRGNSATRATAAPVRASATAAELRPGRGPTRQRKKPTSRQPRAAH